LLACFFFPTFISSCGFGFIRTSAPISARVFCNPSDLDFAMTSLEKMRDAVFNSEDRDLILHVGYFFTWYNQVEWRLTLLMAMIMDERDLQSFHEVTRGLDGKTKVGRFKAICDIKKWPMSETFDKQLAYYVTLGNLRNKLAHRALLNDEQKGDRFHFASIDKMPWKVLGIPADDAESSEHIRKLDFFEKGLWLSQFSADLGEILQTPPKRATLGAVNPRAKVPQNPHANPQGS
jgi:hypothetical protein